MIQTSLINQYLIYIFSYIGLMIRPSTVLNTNIILDYP